MVHGSDSPESAAREAACSSPTCRRSPTLGLVLASASPQRRAILERLGVPFTCIRPAVPELEQGEPRVRSAENALRKARAVRRAGARDAVLGFDTLVALDGRIYGKPADQRRRRATLRALSGATHQVISGVALLLDGRQRSGRLPSPRSASGRSTSRCWTGIWPRANGGGGPADMRSRAPARRSCASCTATTKTSSGCRWRRCWSCIQSCLGS